MIEIGKYNKMRVVKEVDFGVYLDGENYGEILLPKRYVPEHCQVDDFVDVFLHLDSEDWLIATTEKPYAVAGEFAYLKTIAVNRVGAFLDWGLTKDLLVPFREQKHRMRENRSYIVHVYFDRKSERLCASSKLDKFLSEDITVQAGDEVDLLIVEETDLGFKAIINNLHWGLIFHSEIFQPLKIGDKVKGFIKKVREDKRIDLSLQKSGYAKVGGLAEVVLNKIKEQGGFLAMNSKTSPDEIYETFKVSKKNFKMALSNLYKERIITIEDDGVRLVD